MSGILPYLINALLYAVPAIYFWRSAWRPKAGAAVCGPRPVAANARGDAPQHRRKGLDQFAVFVPLALHSALLYELLFADSGLHLGVGVAISAILWLTVLIYWLGNFFYNLQGLQTLVIPVAAFCAAAPAFFPALHPLENTAVPAFRAHLLIGLLAYSLFTIASLHVVLMAMLERRLHGGAMPPILQRLPPLLTMEKLLFRIIAAGFVLLTLTLVSGFIFSEDLFGKPLQLTHKTVFALLSWLIFALLLSGRKIYGWRGRMAVRWTLAGFITLVLAYIGSRLVLEVILQR